MTLIILLIILLLFWDYYSDFQYTTRVLYVVVAFVAFVAFTSYNITKNNYDNINKRGSNDINKKGSNEPRCNRKHSPEGLNDITSEEFDNVISTGGKWKNKSGKLKYDNIGRLIPPDYVLEEKKSLIYEPKDFYYKPEVAEIATKLIKNTDATYINKNKLQDALDTLDVFEGKKYNRCWVAEYLPYWNETLKDEVQEMFKDTEPIKPIKLLQIGVFEGLSLIYIANHIFKDIPLEITIIDNFSTETYFNTEETFKENTRDLNITVIKKESHEALLDLINSNITFDFIYCSGSRKPSVCYVDFALLSKVIDENGMMLLDTYDAYSSYEGEVSPTVARNAFISSFARYVDVVKVGKQRLLKFHKVVDDWIPRVKPADCQPSK
jgi:hypothetical protein